MGDGDDERDCGFGALHDAAVRELEGDGEDVGGGICAGGVGGGEGGEEEEEEEGEEREGD